ILWISNIMKLFELTVSINVFNCLYPFIISSRSFTSNSKSYHLSHFSLIVTSFSLSISIPSRVHNKLMTSGLASVRSEEHTSELQSRFDLVCRLLLENKKQQLWR